MALKAILDSLEGLSEDLQKEYKKGEDGKFHLDVEGGEDTGALKRAKDYEKKARQEAEKQLKELQGQLESAQEELDDIRRGAIPKDDVEKLEASWKEKLAKREKELSEQVGAMQGTMQTLLVDNVAQSLASKISTSPDVMIPHIRSRLKADFEDGKAVTRVLDKDGKPSALTPDELAQEFVANEAFAPIIIGSKASGGGASDGRSGGGAPNKLDYSKASPKEIAAHITAKKEGGT